MTHTSDSVEKVAEDSIAKIEKEARRRAREARTRLEHASADGFSLIATRLRSLPAQAEREAVIEECARVCEELFAKDYEHSQRKGGAKSCAAAIRALKPSARGSGG